MGRHLHFTGLVGMCSTACSIGSGLTNFADNISTPDYHTFQAHAKLVASGNYDHLAYISGPSIGAVIVARHIDGPNITIALRPLDGSAGCDVAGTDFRIHSPDLDSSQQPIDHTGEVVVLDDPDGDGRGTLSFVDGRCALLGNPISDAAFPEAAYTNDRFLLRSDVRLLAVEPRAGSIEVLAENLQQIDDEWTYSAWHLHYVTHFAPAWFIASGEFAALDDSGHVAFRYGSQVTEVVLGNDANDYLINDGGQLIEATPDGGYKYATDICGLHGVQFTYVGYRSPCAGGPLRVTSLSGAVVQSVAIDATGDEVLAFDGDFTNPTAFFTRPPSDGSYGKELWFRDAGAAPRKVAAGVAWINRDPSLFPATWMARQTDGSLSGSLLAIVDSDGVSGRFVNWYPGANIVNSDGGIGGGATDQLLSKGALRVPVTQFPNPSLYQLTNYGGETGDFDDPFIGGAVIAQGVPADLRAYKFKSDSLALWEEVASPAPKFGPAIPESSDMLALLANVASNKGRLGLLAAMNAMATKTTDTGISYTASVPRPIHWIASDVLLGGFRFYYKMNALGYIDQWDEQRGAGRFVVHDLDLDSDMVLSDSVRQQFDIWWPWVGVVYAVADGDRQGIWAQQAD